MPDSLRFLIWVFILAGFSWSLSGCRCGAAGKSASKASREERARLSLPAFVPANAVGLGLGQGHWMLALAGRAWAGRGSEPLVRKLHEDFGLDLSHLGRVWVLLFPGAKAGPLLFDPVVVIEGGKLLRPWDGTLEGRSVHKLAGSLSAMDCGLSLCLGTRIWLRSVARALRGQGRARANSDFWSGVVRFLSVHRRGFATVVDLVGRFPAGPNLVRVALQPSGALHVELLGATSAQDLVRAVRSLLDGASKAARRHEGLVAAKKAAQVLAGARVRTTGETVLVDLDGADSLLSYLVAPASSIPDSAH